MTVGGETGNHGTSTEEQDYLDRSKKKVKNNGNPDAEFTDTDYDRTVEATADQIGTIGETGKDKSTHRSFKQALLRSRFNEIEIERKFDCEAAYLSSDEEMENEKDTEETMEGGNTSHPVVKLPAGLLKKVREPWKQCNGFFIVKFEMMEDYTKVFTGGPWVVLDRYVTVRKWQPDFKSDEAEEDTTAIWVRFPNLPIEYYDEKVLYHVSKVLGTPLKIDINTAMAARGKYARWVSDEAEEDTTAIWVRFPNLPIEYYDEKVLYHISKVLGTPLKIDINTAMAARGKYARVCVEMDLRKPFISHLTIGRYHYVVEYEHLHTLCFSCGRVGHRKEKCPEYPVILSEKMMQNVTVKTPGLDSGLGSSRPTGNQNKEACTEEEKSGYGPWTIAPSRRKFQQGKHKSKAQLYKGNRFEVLNSTTVHGDSSRAQEHYLDLDLGHNIATNSISYGPNQRPLPTNTQSSPGMDVDQT
ncbi:uncharacterized protein LOC114262488 [Camellia sinensis]|uniref:uncharacterized protein LOC114262488 n=1 Tax=Camellia sinensis TaxID=4442 RepID=UPI001035A028|nr:uncharacterized protein LOC114262488 [Camellia sinensis]